MKRSRCWDFISSNTLAKRRAQNANDADIVTVQRNYRFEYFLLYLYLRIRQGARRGGEGNARFSRPGIYLGGLCATNLPHVILEKEFSRVFPAFRETERGTNEFERLPKRRSPRHVSLRSPRRGAGKLRSQRTSEGPQTCSTSSHNTWTGGRLARGAITSNGTQAPPPPPPV